MQPLCQIISISLIRGASHCNTNAAARSSPYHKIIFYYHESLFLCSSACILSIFFDWCVCAGRICSHFVNKWDVSSAFHSDERLMDSYRVRPALLLWCINCARRAESISPFNRDENALYYALRVLWSPNAVGLDFVCLPLSSGAVWPAMHYWDLSPLRSAHQIHHNAADSSTGITIRSDCLRGFYPCVRLARPHSSVKGRTIKLMKC